MFLSEHAPLVLSWGRFLLDLHLLTLAFWVSDTTWEGICISVLPLGWELSGAGWVKSFIKEQQPMLFDQCSPLEDEARWKAPRGHLFQTLVTAGLSSFKSSSTPGFQPLTVSQQSR